jgi:hypothetical protein
MRKPEEIRSEIDHLVEELKKVDEKRYRFADVRVIAKAGILSALSAEMAEASTRRIVRLTWALAILTAGLLVLTVILCWDTHAIAKREANHDNKTKTSQIPNIKLDTTNAAP